MTQITPDPQMGTTTGAVTRTSFVGQCPDCHTWGKHLSTCAMQVAASNESWLDSERRKIDEAYERGVGASRLARPKERRERIATAVLGHIIGVESKYLLRDEPLQVAAKNAVGAADALIVELDKEK